MADQKLENSDEQLDKLKELERTLARELDQQVRLTEPSDVRLSGTIALNPTLELTPREKLQVPAAPIKALEPMTEIMPAAPAAEPPPPVQENSKKNEDDEISLQDVDKLLEDIDEGFKQAMDQIKNDLGPMKVEVSGLESIAIGKDYLDQDKKI